MKKLTLVILLFAIVPGVYAKKTKKKKSANDIVSVSIHRTVCFGMCPDYKVEIDNKGMATYTANRFTPDTGIFQKNIGKAKSSEIIEMVRKYRADTCKEMYENRIPDLPGLNVTIKYNKRKKTIYSANFGPEFLMEIAEAIDAAGKKTENNGWRKIGMPKLD